LNDQTRDKFLKLIKYYKECVQIENLSDIKFYSNKEGRDFIQCPSESEWLSSAKEAYKMKGSSTKDFGRESRWTRRPVSHYYAYPIYVHKHTRRDGQPSTSIRPFLTFPVELVKTSDGASITRPTFLKPQINTGVLDARSVGARPEQKRAFMQRVMEGWVDTDEFEKNIKSVIEIMVDELGETNFVADSFQSLKSELIDLDSAESGFYSCGIIFATQGSNYTIGLEEELNEIEQKVQNDSMSLPVIKALIDRNQLNESNSDANQLVEITPLNDEQRQAVRSAFKNNLTIVTGPPGTGKSQVVLNIIANAVARGESVLAALTPKIIEKNATVGIVTPFREQENRIRDLVARRLDAGLIDTMDLKIDTAHGYQGDERDLMIFSTVISRGSPESTIGFLSVTQNLFNVAITRARSELHVVGDRTACLRSGVEYLEKFAQYISQSNRINLYQMNNKHELFDSPWEELFFNKLKERGINATPQLSIHQYKLDLALPGFEPPINIEIDGEYYHKNISGERCIDDVKRDMRLS